MRYRIAAYIIFFVLSLSTFSSSTLLALPFNDDMVHDQLKTSEVMRDAPQGSVPVGGSKRYVKDRASGLTLKNPIPRNAGSVENGKRLWAVNCTPCHGRYTGEAHPEFSSMAVFEKPIDPIVAGATSGPVLVSKGYIEDGSKTDGHLFSYIHFGGLAIMPRYGYKLSPREHWDIVNYIRDMQQDFSDKVLSKNIVAKEQVEESK